MEKPLHYGSKIKYLTVLLLAGTVMNIVALFFYPEEGSNVLISNILFIVLNLISVICLWYASVSSRERSKRLSNAWLLIALSQLAFMLGDVLWFVYESVLFIEPFPSFADVFYLLCYPLLLLGIFLIPTDKTSKMDGAKKWLDAVIVFLAAAMVFWITTIIPLTVDLQENTFVIQFLTLAYPAGDIMLFAALLIILYKNPGGRLQNAYLFLSLSLLIQIITDIVFSFQSLTGSYISGGWVDIGWVLGYLLMGIAGLVHAKTHDMQEQKPKKMVDRFPAAYDIEGIRDRLPYIFILFCYTFLFFTIEDHNIVNYQFLIFLIGVITAAVLLRQYLVITENKKLNVELKQAIDQIRQKSLNLQTMNNDLRHEIMERKRIEDQLAFDALHDPLTKLPNRTLLLDRLNHAIELSKRSSLYSFAVLFIDLDQFKSINDCMGHSAGDCLLIDFVERIQHCIRKSDTFARLGGDEFTILLEDQEKADNAEEVADRIQEALTAPYTINEQNFFITASIGIVKDADQSYNNAETVLQDADIAMYHAKECGKAQYKIFTTPLRTEMLSRIKLESEMRLAVGKDFILHYQPIFTLKEKKLTGFEALLRWKHPRLGLLYPADFLAVAESTGLIVEIGEWVLRESCSHLKSWMDQYPQFADICINVNLSGKQFMQPNFLALLKSILQETKLPHRALHLEITETVLLDNQQVVNDLFNEIHNMGVLLEIDDFGSGYSSIGYLQRFPVDTIKIDRLFIQELEKSTKGSRLVQSMVKMAEDLDMKIIAEGIETNTQLGTLQKMECQYGQGYFFCHPLPETEVLKVFQEQERLINCE